MKNLTCFLIAGFLVSQASAAILNNNFDSVTLDSYSGGTQVTDGVTPPSTNGEAFGAAEMLGNASGPENLSVEAGIGVGGSAAVTARNLALRSRNVVDVGSTIYFNFDFLYEGSTNTGNGFVGAGFARADNDGSTGIDGGNTYSSGMNNRVEVGLSKTGVEDEAKLVGMGQLNNQTDLVGSGGDVTVASLTATNWYNMSFGLSYDNETGDMTVTDLMVTDMGSDGMTTGSVVLSLASTSASGLVFGGNFAGDNFGYAYISSNGDRGVDTVDNIMVEVPEPSIYAMFAGLGALALALYRRRK